MGIGTPAADVAVPAGLVRLPHPRGQAGIRDQLLGVAKTFDRADAGHLALIREVLSSQAPAELFDAVALGEIAALEDKYSFKWKTHVFNSYSRGDDVFLPEDIDHEVVLDCRAIKELAALRRR